MMITISIHSSAHLQYIKPNNLIRVISRKVAGRKVIRVIEVNYTRRKNVSHGHFNGGGGRPTTLDFQRILRVQLTIEV